MSKIKQLTPAQVILIGIHILHLILAFLGAIVVFMLNASSCMIFIIVPSMVLIFGVEVFLIIIFANPQFSLKRKQNGKS